MPQDTKTQLQFSSQVSQDISDLVLHFFYVDCCAVLQMSILLG